jgi:hypothetical protein
MSEANPTFIDLALNGDVLPSEIDDYVDEWHDGPSTLELYEFLGLTFEEYTLWASEPDSIDIILAARHRSQSLSKAVNDNLRQESRLAARSDRAWKLTMLRKWIDQQSARLSRD